MSAKAEKPVLSGLRIKTRKRDEKEKNDPIGFRDAIIQGLLDSGSDLDQVSKFLDSASSRLNYRRYGEVLFDVLFAGGVLAPGGTLINEGTHTKSEVCVFNADADVATLKTYYEVFYKLIRRYKYLEKSFDEELKKLIRFLKGFGDGERQKLARIMGIFFANGLGNATCLSCLFEDHLVKDGVALDFATALFNVWVNQKDMQSVAAALKRAGLEGKLMLLLPINKRTQENFENHFKAAGLDVIIDYQRAKANAETKRHLQKELEEMFREEQPIKEIVAVVTEHVKHHALIEQEVVSMIWTTLMAAVEWNKKEELVAEQSLKYLRTWASLLKCMASTPRAELTLMLKVQEYCYENQSFMKVFSKIIVLFYKSDVLSEDTILKWYREGHSSKGKSVFLEQTKKFIEWLEQAEEESDEDDDDDKD